MKATPSPYGFRPTSCEIRRGGRLIYKPDSVDGWYEFHEFDNPTHHVRFSVPEKDALSVCRDIYEGRPPIDVLWEKSLGLGVRQTLVVEMDNVELDMHHGYEERGLVVTLWTAVPSRSVEIGGDEKLAGLDNGPAWVIRGLE